MTILGLRHIALVCGDAQRTVDFYARVLGLRLVKQTVNFDEPGSYHLYFGGELGRPGTAVTFFEWPGAPRGYPGLGGTHHFAPRVADETAQLKWKRRLTDHGLKVDGPLDRHYFKSIYFNDPDGGIIEIATDGPGWTRGEAPDALGQIGAGQTHHFSLAVAGETPQLEWRERLVRAFRRVSPVLDREHIKSIYTQDPGGHSVKLTTLSPGFAVDEPSDGLGRSLQPPPRLEPNRGAIERRLKPLTLPAGRAQAVGSGR
ncbi:MAG: VOC family protein [Anaerolineales bacterium]|nr:VOC family protein [Anaerolineales bacterium]